MTEPLTPKEQEYLAICVEVVMHRRSDSAKLFLRRLRRSVKEDGFLATSAPIAALGQVETRNAYDIVFNLAREQDLRAFIKATAKPHWGTLPEDL